ncbi:Imm49 family immunity protein [Undibacterium sp. SXout7W]|uniref:Imm49 family immunity protein n=1 Tax=Undibacterium sp. SXout7W TaxID=3413049 RepID=UPI003BF3E789
MILNNKGESKVIGSYTEEQKRVLENLAAGIKNDEEENGAPIAAQYISEGKGSFDGCIRNLRSLHSYKAIYAWFAKYNLEEFKLQASISNKLHYIHCVEVEPRGMTKEADYFLGLLSDYEPMIRWMMELQPGSAQGIKWINNPKEHFFRHWQMTLAVRGDWTALRQRAELFLSDVPTKMKKFAVDQRFYLALSQGDQAGMQVALEELVSPKVAKVRNEVFELAFPSAFISCYATMYAKIAWRHGYQVKLDTPLIPAEWLPVSPLDTYPDPYEFMQKYVI